MRSNTSQCPRSTKEMWYKALIRSVPEYGGVIWYPHTTSDSNKLETIQRRSASYAYGDHRWTKCMAAMLQQLQGPTLAERIQCRQMWLCCLTINSLVELPIDHLKRSIDTSTWGHNSRIKKTHIYTYGIILSGQVRLWNAIPHKAIDCTTLESFKVGDIKTHTVLRMNNVFNKQCICAWICRPAPILHITDLAVHKIC